MKRSIRLIRIYFRTFRRFLAKDPKLAGFSMVELVASMAITLLILAVAVITFSNALSTRERENSRVDALTSAQAAINILSREISNAGYGLKFNGIILDANCPDGNNSDDQRLHIRTNLVNNTEETAYNTNQAGEDITFFYDTASQSVLRYDANTGITSGVINRVSHVEFGYFDYLGSTTNEEPNDCPSVNTGRVRIKLWVELPEINGQPSGQVVEFSSDVTLRNSPYMLKQY